MRWLGVFIAVGLLHGQGFEVATIKLDAGCGRGGRAPDGPSPGRLSLSCVRVRSLIAVAYGDFPNGAMPVKRLEAVGGPGWLDSDYYDLTAKAEGNVPFAQMAGPMLQALLEDRLKLKVHKEAKEVPVYTLTVAKNGPKLKPSAEGSCVPVDMNNFKRPEQGQPMPKYCGVGAMRGNGEGLMTADWYGTTMAELAGRMLSGRVDRPVVDHTGLTGRYDVHLQFARDDGTARLNGADSPAPPASDGPSIFTALQEQLGLKLSPEKGPVEVIVVDQVEKPSEN